MSKTQKPREPYPITFFSGVIFGTVLGSLLALWYAPQSGKETVNAIQQRFRLQRDRIEDTLAAGPALARRQRSQITRRLTDNNP